uniref:chitinase n=1 Tax=Branchiostoma floridae TaxID=7739 RepID=C3YS78_BRAFL|eukprot:XP_002600971.1 hypothetical protein BRAFLDRAFT_79169 [Branchiostoma floridae]
MTIVTVSTPEPKVEASEGNADFRGAERIYTGHKVWGNETERREDSFGDYIGRVEGPAFAGSEWATTGNYTHIASKEYFGIMGFVDLEIEDGFGQFSVTPSNSLRLTGAQVTDAGRYWCKVTSGGIADIKATVLKVKGMYPSPSTLVAFFHLTVPEFTCAGKADGYYPDPEDCAMYYQCLYGFPQPFHRPCGYAGMVFNPEHLYCDWAFNVGPPCGSRA